METIENINNVVAYKGVNVLNSFNFLFIFTTNSSGNDGEKKEALFFWASFLGSNSNQFMISSRFGCCYLNQLNRLDNNNQVNLLFATSKFKAAISCTY